MISKVIMPKLGQTMEEGTIAKWHKAEGERVEKGEVLFEITTDKATLEVESNDSGILKKILARDGDLVPVTQVIAYIGEEDDDIPVDYGQKKQEPVSAIKKSEVEVVVSKLDKIIVSPRARSVACKRGIDLSLIKGTGPGGRILEEDVLAFRPTLSSNLVPLSPMRKIIAQRMSQSKASIPHSYLRIEVDMSICIRERENFKQQGKRISYNDFIIRACALSIYEFPIISAFYTKDGIQMRSEINIGFAVSIDDGLIVPVIKSADAKKVEQIAEESRILIEKARSKKLVPDDYSGGVMTISNVGMFDILECAPIINPGESAIIGVGKISDRVVLKEGMVATEKIMVLTLSFDHRIMDGAIGAKFLQKIKQLLENPTEL